MEVGKNVELPVSLTVGLKEIVTVTAATPLVDRESHRDDHQHHLTTS